MLPTDNNNLHERERAEMWELFAQLLDFSPDFRFTAKELAQQTHYNKKQLNRLLYRLYKAEALTMRKTENGAIYSLNKAFLEQPTSED
ncbi:MAG TPA: hypothetical protein VF273_09465 [Pelobium sp.]